jgi:hypothetical protein
LDCRARQIDIAIATQQAIEPLAAAIVPPLKNTRGA